MYSKEVGDMFCDIVGTDNGHNDLCDFIIWNGEECVSNFLQDPLSVISLAEIMSDQPGFRGAIILW